MTERDQQIEALTTQVTALNDELANAHGEIDTVRADLDSAHQGAEHDLQVRDEAIAKLKEGIERQRAGIAEAIKVALIKDRPFFQRLYAHRRELSVFSPPAMERLIVSCAELHLEHIRSCGDPFELGRHGRWTSVTGRPTSWKS